MLRKTLLPGIGVLALFAFQVFSTAPAAAQAPAAGGAAQTPAPGRAGQGAAPGAAQAPAPGGPAQPGGRGRTPSAAEIAAANAPRTIAPYFVKATAPPKPVDPQGFIQRWLLLEPINKPNRSNTVFTDSYVRNAFNTEYFPNQFTVVPRDGDKVKVGDQDLAWHALDSTLFNVKLFRFAYGLNKPVYGVIFWAVTVVNSPREIRNVRVAAGSNAASIWWVNGKEAVDLFTDRRMVMDDVVSQRLTLNKGR
ncbi:MAG TPA: hypothetical protein VMU19_15675, partial [Bryobacteraceae bacterium]|nr:hypothetical protein [Bryobacteraceae bacterium]